MIQKVKNRNLMFGSLALACGLLIITMCILTAQRSYGLEGDELFSYISSTSQGGWKGICFLDDQTWYEGSYFHDALVTTGSERFNLPMVVENQAMDTHPPLFYLFLNLVCSFFPGQFSRWFGISINIVFLLLVGIGLYLLLNHYLKNSYAALVLSTLFCCSYLSISMTLFIRMYVLLMVCFLYQSFYHLKLFEWATEDPALTLKKNRGKYLLLGLLTIVGALTHYYYLVYQFMISALYVFLLWRKKQIRQIIDYIITMAASGILYCIIYPAVFTHIFFKYRGRDAVHKFLKTTTLFGDGIEMFKTFNNNLFKGFLLPLVCIMLAATVILALQKKFEWKKLGIYTLLMLPSIIYFWGISKASPFITIRYVSPVAALLYTYIILWLKLLWDGIGIRKSAYPVICVLMGLLVFFFPLTSVKEPYFKERTQIVEELAKSTDYCAYITGDEYNWKMWEDYVIYPKFKGLFFIDGRQKFTITDEQFLNQDELVIFVDTSLNLDEVITCLNEALPELTYEVKLTTPFVYIIYFS